jgi:4-amino-4-deoxychorismate lyase
MALSHCWVDGVELTAVPADDRGLNYADGAFETLWCEQGVIECLPLHRERLGRALQVLRFAQPLEVAYRMFSAAEAHLATITHCGSARLTVTRGSGPRGYSPPSKTSPRYVLSTTPLSVDPALPARCGFAAVSWAEQPQLAGMKLLARTEQVLAAQEAMERGWDDAIMLDGGGLVVSSSRGNIFIFKRGKFVTPELSRCGIAGTRRQLLMATVLPELGFEVIERAISPEEVASAEGLLISNALRGAQPVISLNERAYDLNAMPVSRIQTALRECAASCAG